MDQQMRFYWEIIEKNYSTDKLLYTSFNPLREFEEEFIEGPILDLGCGQSNFLIEYSKGEKDIIAIDNESFQLEKLKNRIKNYAGADRLQKIQFLNITIPKEEIPLNKYSLIFMSNFLHFFSISDCKTIVERLLERSKKGTMIYIQVHSTKHPHNNPDDPKNNDYFKHYFSEEDLNKLFEEKHFERLFFADIQNKSSQFQKEIVRKWYDKIFDENKIFNQEYREKRIKGLLEDDKEAGLISIFRRK